MKAKTFLALLAGVMMFGLTACSTNSDSQQDGEWIEDNGSMQQDSSGLAGDVFVEDNLGYGGMAGDTVTQIGQDGSLIIGDPNLPPDGLYDPNFAGPQALRENNTVYFKYDSDQIQDEYVSVMQAHAQYLRNNPDSRIIIEGHTDERGTPEYNIALGERRARAVARYMQNLGVDVNQLSIVSYGEEKPLDPGHAEANWKKNRRAVINY